MSDKKTEKQRGLATCSEFHSIFLFNTQPLIKRSSQFSSINGDERKTMEEENGKEKSEIRGTIINLTKQRHWTQIWHLVLE